MEEGISDRKIKVTPKFEQHRENRQKVIINKTSGICGTVRKDPAFMSLKSKAKWLSFPNLEKDPQKDKSKEIYQDPSLSSSWIWRKKKNLESSKKEMTPYLQWKKII